MVILRGPFTRAVDPDGKHRGLLGLFYLVVAVFFAFPAVGAILPDGPAGYFFQRCGNVAIGYILYFFGALLFIVLILAVFRLIYRLITHRKWEPPRKWSAILLAVLLIGTVIVNIAGAFNAQDVRVTKYEIQKEQLKQSEPLKIVLIADLHIGVNSRIGLYEDMVKRINEQEPDMVLIAGDLVTSAFGAMEDPDAYADVMREIEAKYGPYVVYGNHDVDEPLFCGFTYQPADEAERNPAMEKWIDSCGWQLLTDETITLHGLNDLVIAGRRDETRPGDGVETRMDLKTLLKDVDPEAPVILLEHEPVELEELEDYGIDLTVCGHTHDGQIFPGNVYGRIADPQSYGIRDWGSSTVAVTSGVGYYGPPIRVGTKCEIVVIDAR